MPGKFHCRVCGGSFELALVINDICTKCLISQAAKMEDMNKAEAKAAKARVGNAPLLPPNHRIGVH